MRLSREKKTAGALGAGVLITASAVGLGASAEAFGPAAEDLGCRIYIGDTGTGTFAVEYQDTFALTVSPSSPSVGDTVTLTFSAVDGLTNGPVPITAGTQTISATIDVSGATTDSLTLTTAASYPAADVPANGQTGPYTLTGDFVVAEGATTFALQQLRFDDSSATNADIYCTDADTNLTDGVDPKVAPVVSTVILDSATAGDGTGEPTEPGGTVTVTTTVTATQTVTQPGEPGATVTVTAPGETVTVTAPGPTVTVTETPTACEPEPDHGKGHDHKKGKKHKQHKKHRSYGHHYHRSGWDHHGDGWRYDDRRGDRRDRRDDRHGNGHGNGNGHDHDDCDDNGAVDEVLLAGAGVPAGGSSGGSGGAAAAALALGAAAMAGAATFGVGAARRPRGLHD